VVVPGCPPPPARILAGILTALSGDARRPGGAGP